MSVVRQKLKAELESIQLGDIPIFRVWIHEDESHLPLDEASWNQCMRRARQADLVLVLYNGNAGWSGGGKVSGDYIGICHAELQQAYSRCPGKVRSVQLPAIKAKTKSPNDRFQKYFQNLMSTGPQVSTGEEAIQAARKSAVAALLQLARAGVGVNSKGNYYAGEALAWTRMDFQQRRDVTTDVVVEFLSQQSGSQAEETSQNPAIIKLNGKKVAFVCDCIPSSLSTAAARELVGQPFLRDHEIVVNFPRGVAGPVHLIACQKTVTESQAIRQLGFPDAVVVSGPFGIYVADEVQKIQMVFVVNCRDEGTTRHQVQLFLQWLTQQGEDRLLTGRAASRRKIANLIAEEHRPR